MKVLVCEDDAIVLKVIQLALNSDKILATYVRDGRKGLQLLQDNNDFDLIITDIHMPFNNGDEILDLVRVKQKKATPIIMISSDREEEVIKLALKSGVNEFISKPLELDELNRKLKRFLK